ncbi:MAG TPA: permease [Nitrospira sp.]|nr:permease [Nitrospira sp.]
MDLALILLIVAVAGVAAAIALTDPALLWVALSHSGKLLGNVWIELLLGFVLAGLIHVMIPEAVVLRWLGKQNLWYGVLAGWGLGLLIPGGPYVTFPIAANLLRQGAAPGPLIALISAKVLLSPVRVLSFEAPLLGWPMTAARLLPSLLLPPLLGLMGQWLFQLFDQKSS